MASTMDDVPVAHRLLAATVAAVWGLNFLAIHVSLEHYPPLLLAVLRWTLIAVPTVLLVPRPQVPLRWLLGYGAGFGVLQFAFLYSAMDAGMPAGLASLVLQSSAPFTVVLGALLLREQVSPARALGVAIAVVGLGVVGAERLGGATWWPFVLTLCGGLGWALGNLSSRQAAPPRPLHLTLWMSVVPPLPMLVLSVAIEGPRAIREALGTALSTDALPANVGLLYTCLVGTVIGSGIWTWLMARHPAGLVAPWSMLVPVVGMATAWVALDERPSGWELVGAGVVVLGVLLTSRPRSAVGVARTPTAVGAARSSGP